MAAWTNEIKQLQFHGGESLAAARHSWKISVLRELILPASDPELSCRRESIFSGWCSTAHQRASALHSRTSHCGVSRGGEAQRRHVPRAHCSASSDAVVLSFHIHAMPSACGYLQMDSFGGQACPYTRSASAGLDKEGVRCSSADAGEVIAPVTSAERYEKTCFIRNRLQIVIQRRAGACVCSSAHSDERHVALFKTLRRRPAAVPVIAAVSPAGEVDAPCARTRARSAQSSQGWAVLFERPLQLEGTGCIRACFRQTLEAATHQSCTIAMSCCFQLDVRSLHRRCPRRRGHHRRTAARR